MVISILNLFFFLSYKITFNLFLFVLTLQLIRGFQVSLSVKNILQFCFNALHNNLDSFMSLVFTSKMLLDKLRLDFEQDYQVAYFEKNTELVTHFFANTNYPSYTRLVWIFRIILMRWRMTIQYNIPHNDTFYSAESNSCLLWAIDWQDTRCYSWRRPRHFF